MRLCQNSTFSLDYDAASDILHINYTDLQGLSLSDVMYSLQLLVEAIRTYQVKKLLLDLSRSIIEVSDDKNKAITVQFLSDLILTQVQKVARIQRVDPHVEKVVQTSLEHLKEVGLIPFQLQTFASKSDAIAWLLEETGNLASQL
ncbi:hypothetical protein ACSX1A_06100 [Pontibacter sp. MBLB2868]|uniref:hypothetical protein n=1 Tax=Pontibacter sp. MBLB2868 TaxID=3451555 RepID=UPI003F7570ED